MARAPRYRCVRMGLSKVKPIVAMRCTPPGWLFILRCKYCLALRMLRIDSKRRGGRDADRESADGVAADGVVPLVDASAFSRICSFIPVLRDAPGFVVRRRAVVECALGRMRLLVILLGAFWQTSALAEVSDKMHTIPALLGQGAIVAALVFLLCLWRWWLALFASALPILLFFGTYGLWQEVAMRQALLQEQGLVYFVAMLVADTLVFAGVVAGGAVAWRRRAAQQGTQAEGLRRRLT